MFAQLGEHTFQGLKAPSSWNEAHAVRYGRIQLVNDKDVIQPTGTELMEINISVQYSVDFCDPDVEITALKKSMYDTLQLPFISGQGDIIGKFVITGIDISNEKLSPTGMLEMATVNIKLLECATTDPKTKGTAVASTKPVAQAPAPAVVSPSNQIAADISQGKNKVSAIKATLSKIKKGTMSFKRGVREVRQLADATKQAYTTAKTKVTATKKIIKRAGQLPTSLDGAISYAENLAKLDQVADMSVMEMNINQLSESSEKVSAHATPVAAFSASREGGN